MPSEDLRRDFQDRDDLIDYLRGQFPEAVTVSPEVSATRGGRAAAEARLEAMQPGKAYRSTRNQLDGAVTRLSPYIRHGVVGLAEVRDTALAKVNRDADAEKFVNELGWRDYWQRLYESIGAGVWEDREPYKTGFSAADYADTLPEDIRDGTTGLACMDGFSRELRETGYLHNHARMWTAAYVIHWRRVKWQAGARWFLTHLLDGDPASNNLSWQWVGSTFSHKPYIFNRENLERHSGGVYCQGCPLADRSAAAGGCPFDASYEALDAALFPDKPTEDARDQGRRGGKRGGRR